MMARFTGLTIETTLTGEAVVTAETPGAAVAGGFGETFAAGGAGRVARTDSADPRLDV